MITIFKQIGKRPGEASQLFKDLKRPVNKKLARNILIEIQA